MLNKITLLFFLLLISVGATFAQSGTGTIKGTVVDEAGEPLPFVNVTLWQNGNMKTGATTDFDGHFKISNVEPGKYDIEVSYVGYQKQKLEGIIVKGSKLLPLPNIVLKEGDLLDEVEVVAYKVPLIDKDGGATGGTVTREELARMPGRSAGAIASTVGGVQTDANGNVQSVRGSRSDATYYYIDGIKVRGSSSLPKSAIQEVAVLTGGLPANYGDVTGGIISITTRGASREYFGGVEYITSGYKFGQKTYGLDHYGYNLLEGVVSGPLLMKKDSAGKKTDPILGFFVSGNFTSMVDPRPFAIKNYKVKDDVRAGLIDSPVRENKTGDGILYNALFLNQNDFEQVKFRQNVSSTSASLAGKIDVNVGSNMNLTFGGNGQFNRRHFLNSWADNLFNYPNNPLEQTYTWRTYVKFTQRFANAKEETAEEAKANKGGIKNAFYTLMVDYTQERRTRQNDIHKDKIFNYGYVGKFEIDRNPTYTVKDLNGDGFIDALVQNGNQESNVRFTPSKENADLAAITRQFFDLQTQGVNNMNDIVAGNALRNGDRPQSVYNLWNNIGYQYNGYSKRDRNQFRLTGQGSADVGNHAITVGFEYEQRVNRSFSASPVGLWTQMRQLQNKHIKELDESNGYVENLGTFYRVTYGQLNSDPGEYNGSGEQSFFDYNVRKKLGLDPDGTDWLNIDAMDPNFFTLDMFSADELISGQNAKNYVSYYGYDYTGKRLKEKVTFDDFFTAKDDYGNLKRSIGAFQPVYMAGYIMDKFAFDDLIFNVGVRVDRYDANQKVLKDRYLTYAAKTKGEVSELNGVAVQHPDNIPDNAVVYVDDVNDPTAIKGYRVGKTWYNAIGNETNDLNEIKSSGNIQPLLQDGVDPSKPINSSVFKDYKPQVNVMPRISFSFPISDNALFFSHYDVLTKRPTANGNPVNRLNPTDYLFLGQNTNVLNNPNLKPEKTIDFELGFQQALNKSSSLKLSAFYKENRNMVTIVFVEGAYPNDYKTWGNRDFGTVKGLTAAYDLRRTKNISLRASYTLQFAQSTGSNPNSSLNLINARQPNLRTVYPTSFDQRHVLTGSLDFRYDEGKNYNGPVIKGKQIFKNSGINFRGNYASGRPYTQQVSPNGSAFISSNDGTTKGNPFGARKPGTFRMNMQIDRNIEVSFGKDKKKKANMNVYLWVSNLFNTLNINNVYRATGNPNDDGYLNSANAQNTIQAQTDINSFKYYYALKANNPFNYGTPRQIRLGVKLDF